MNHENQIGSLRNGSDISSRCNCMDVQMKIESEDVKDLMEQIDEGIIIEYLRGKGYKVEEEE